ncbi:MAG: fatty acid desaturase [Chloroflexi bacterium]|nr:MAG: fatty acid desaturase [Chloroflexota bacterium]
MQSEAPPRSELPIRSQEWKKAVAKYQIPNARKSIWQIINTLIPFVAIWYLMVQSLSIGYWLTLLLAIPAAGLMVRMFIIQHDCGHGSFFKSRKANDWVGTLASIITWTPYRYWQKSHAIHHANAGNLEHRGIGDIYTMTVQEYLQASWWGKLKYRIYRHPLFLFGVAPTALFVFLYRFPTSKEKALKKVRHSVYWTNLALAVVVGGLMWLIGVKEFLLIQIPITILASTAGAWLFYVQHQFEDAYWAGDDSWEYSLAALKGSSFYKLPKVLQWFTGNIGFHHIHHLSPRIPNYNLEACHNDNELFQNTVTMTLRSSIKTLSLSLWDEEQNKLIGFRQLKARPAPVPVTVS